MVSAWYAEDAVLLIVRVQNLHRLYYTPGDTPVTPRERDMYVVEFNWSSYD